MKRTLSFFGGEPVFSHRVMPDVRVLSLDDTLTSSCRVPRVSESIKKEWAKQNILEASPRITSEIGKRGLIVRDKNISQKLSRLLNVSVGRT